MAVIGALVALLVVLLASQLLLPGFLEGRIENRLTAGGGSATVELSALPALRLLAKDGDRLSIEGRGLSFRLEPSKLRSRSLADFDGFDEVALHLRSVDVAPFHVEAFDLTRVDGGEPYRLRIAGATSAGALVAYGLDRLGSLLAVPRAGLAPLLGAEQGRVPFAIEADLESDDGRPRVVGARGTVAGLPAGPLVELLAATILTKV
jgi:hypothetical protein